MYYKLEGRVRYSEIGEKGYLSLPGILNYFQDCCTFHSESVGQGMKAKGQEAYMGVICLAGGGK